MIDSNQILTTLGEVGQYFYNELINKLNGGNYPSGDAERGYSSIQNATMVKSPQSAGNGTYYIDVVIDVEKAPYARAYEWGSGEHAEGGGGKYQILPRNDDGVLVFPEEDWPNWTPGDNSVFPINGIFFLGKVMHPGIEARPYLRPTISMTEKERNRMLALGMKSAILAGVPRVEIIR